MPVVPTDLSARACDFPRRTPLAAYTIAQRQFCDDAEKLIPSLTVLGLGGFSCPGVSDIDLMCIVPRDTPRPVLVKLCALTHGNGLFVHGPFILPDDLSSEIKWLMPNVTYTRLVGQRTCHDTKLSNNELFFAAASHLADALVEQAIWFFIMCSNEAIPVRRLILRLSGLRYQLSLATELGIGIDSAATSFAGRVTTLRQSWADTGHIDLETIWELSVSAVELALRAAQQIACAVMRDIPMDFDRNGEEIILGRVILRLGSDEGMLRVRYAHIFSRRRRYFEASVGSSLFDLYLLMSQTLSNPSHAQASLRQRSMIIRRWTEFVQKRGVYGACLPPTLFGLTDAKYLARIVDGLVSRRLLRLSVE